jgi:hypothetical protein
MPAPEADRAQYAGGTAVPDIIDNSTRQWSRGLNPVTGAKGAEPTEPAAAVTSIAPTGGTTAGGTQVTLTGTNLGGSTGVTVGGAAATGFSVESETEIRFTTPAGTAGAKAVVVTNPAGNGTGVNFTYA